MNAADLAAYGRDGFLVMPDFLPATDCDALQARADELVAGLDPGPVRTIFSARDQGPGIANLADILAGRYRSRSGLGLGILGTKRLADRFAIDTKPTGTHVEVEVTY